MEPIFKDPDLCIRLCNEAETWLRTPFHHGGRVKKAGTDCIGLVNGIFMAVLPDFKGLDFPAYNLEETLHRHDSRLEIFLDTYPRVFRIAKFHEDQKDKFKNLRLLPGDMLGFRIGNGMHHLGLSLGGKKFIECRQKWGTIESWLDDGTYEFRLLAVYRPVK